MYVFYNNDKSYDLEEWLNEIEIKYKFNLFYQHDLTTYSTINVEQKHDKTKKAVNLFIIELIYL